MPTISRASRARRGERFTMTVGDTLTVEAAAGDVVMAQSADELLTEAADASGVARFSGLAAGIYWLATKTGDEDACRLGAIHVLPLHDERETRMLAEIKSLDEKIISAEATNVNVSGDGFSVGRVGIRKLHEQREKVRSQLADYRRSRAGFGGVRWSR